MLKWRTLSHLIKISVLPEIDRRIAVGLFQSNALPIEIYALKLIQKKLPDGKIENLIQINDEVEIIVKTKAKRPIAKDEELMLEDIDPEECFISPPEFDGNPAAYFLAQRLYLDYFLAHDFRPNIPGFADHELEEIKMRYPVKEFAEILKFLDIVKPIVKLEILSKNNWPPAPGYFMDVIGKIHNDSTIIDGADFYQVVSASYERSFWEKKIEFWEKVNFFPGRLQYLKRSIEAHFQNDFIASIYVLVPQFEGIILDYLRNCGQQVENKTFRECLDDLKHLIKSRKMLIFPQGVIDAIFTHLKTGTFWKKSSDKIDPNKAVNRHGIVHGVFTGFECEELSLKYLILLDALSLIILHDKIMTFSI